MNDKLDEILDLLKSQNEMIKDIHDYVKEVTSEKYIGESRMTNFSINLAADILTEAISPKIKGMMVNLLKEQGWPYMSIEFCKKEFFLLDEELESFKEFLNDPTRNIYHSIDGIKIVKSEDGKLCGVGRMPRHLRT